MGKQRFTESEWRNNPWFRQLCRALLLCRTEGDLANFLRDVATLSELKALGERFEVARQLDQGASYREASESTGASTATVTRVARFFNDGAGGYRRTLEQFVKLRRLNTSGTKAVRSRQ